MLWPFPDITIGVENLNAHTVWMRMNMQRDYNSFLEICDFKF